MNVLQDPEAENTSDLRIWDNAAFDNGDSQDFTSLKAPQLVSVFNSFESDDSTKENQSPFVLNSQAKIRPNGLGNSKVKPLGEQDQELKKIDGEIEETKKAIDRLSSRLRVLEAEKAKKLKKIVEKKKGSGLGLSEMNPVEAMQSRRKSCFWKLQEIGEEKVVKKERGKSVSPKSRKGLSVARNAATTIGIRKGVKKDEGVLESIQPKKLFRDVEKSGVSKKSTRPGRVVASRYNSNQSTIQAAVKKRSLPDNDKDESKRCDKKRASFVAKTPGNGENRVKKRWEIPNEIVVFRNGEADESPPSVSVVHDLIPSIRISRCVNETPRDSGPVKRMSEMVGKKSFFSIEEDDVDVEASVCQELSFVDEDAQGEV
ncbi:hypothetical protein DCAR_0418126 [Daucus carota subsp. sativus]|uniref:Uncharacterized protein n=1 Tax=Daucus carota subsp. sativus TaxID=79200 RepID=A0A165Z6A0_DAUCS|nr:PREDICTED: uncharacterized protein LOC108217517 [Daucus carota subsp. sativus]WOG98781.1 hypothetical protein DCAR_0418126 [Daucus carota subsp. sativus]